MPLLFGSLLARGVDKWRARAGKQGCNWLLPLLLLLLLSHAQTSAKRVGPSRAALSSTLALSQTHSHTSFALEGPVAESALLRALEARRLQIKGAYELREEATN